MPNLHVTFPKLFKRALFFFFHIRSTCILIIVNPNLFATEGFFQLFYYCMTIAINNTTDSYVGMEHFLGWDVDDKVFNKDTEFVIDNSTDAIATRVFREEVTSAFS